MGLCDLRLCEHEMRTMLEAVITRAPQLKGGRYNLVKIFHLFLEQRVNRGDKAAGPLQPLTHHAFGTPPLRQTSNCSTGRTSFRCVNLGRILNTISWVQIYTVVNVSIRG